MLDDLNVPKALHARLVPIATALLAVIAAIASLLSNKSANESLALKNEAILLRAEASDTYNSFEAKSIKERIYEAAVEANPAMPNRVRTRLQSTAEREKTERVPLFARAHSEEQHASGALVRSERLSRAHEVMEGGVALLEISIAIVSISALTSSTFLIGLGAVAAAAGLCLLLYGQPLR